MSQPRTHRTGSNGTKLKTGLVLATLLIVGHVSQVRLSLLAGLGLASFALNEMNNLNKNMNNLNSGSSGFSISNLAQSTASQLPPAPLAHSSIVDQRADDLPGRRDSSPEALEIIRARGFIGEQYTILSRDKTPLSIYHIINPFANPKTLNRYPVLVLHGVAADAAQMVAHSERTQARPPVPGKIVSDLGDTSLALMLANNNFDVYLVDARGTNLNNHQVAQDLDPIESQKYWNFSLDEQIHYDLPAIIDFVLAQSNADKLHYIGFSESTFFMFAFLTRFPDYQDKLVSFVALAPVAYVGHISGLALSLFSLAGLIPDTINANYMPQPMSDTVGVGVRRVCNNPVLARSICAFFASQVAGLGDDEHSRDFYATLMKSTSIKAVKHFLQLVHDKRFGMYDYGPLANMRQYGTVKPPEYDLARIKLPRIVLLRGANDFLSNAVDQALLLAKLGTKPYRDFNYPNLNHIDFLTGRTIVEDINLPAATAMFELLQLIAAQTPSKSILRDPKSAELAGKAYKPVVVVHPNGSREIRFKSNLMSNLVNGVLESENAKQGVAASSAMASVVPIGPKTQAALKQQWDLWQRLDDKVQNLGSDVSIPEFKPPVQLPGLG